MSLLVRVRDITWLAGLLDGEGSFTYKLKGGPSVKVSMTDRDVVDRVARMLGCGVYLTKTTRTGKKMWIARVVGPRARGWMMTMYTEMGVRRRAQIAKSLHLWRKLSHVDARYMKACKLGHPLDGVHGIKRRCRYCRECARTSMRRYRARRARARGTRSERDPGSGRWVAVSVSA